MRFLAGLAVPTERPVGEVDVHPALGQRFPKRRHGLALTDGIGRDERCPDISARGLHEVRRLFVPAADVVQVAEVLPFRAEHSEKVVLLLLAHQPRADERRIAHDVVRSARRAKSSPIQTQGIGFDDVGVGLKREEIDVVAHDALGLPLHLRLGDPQGGHRDRHREIIDLDAVELVDAGTDRAEVPPEQLLPAVDFLHDPVLHPADRDVGLCEEVARAAGRVEEGQRGEPVPEVHKGAPPRCGHLDVQNLPEFLFQSVQKERVDDLMNILDAGVVHPSGTPCLGVERAFKDGSEDGRADSRPVESEAHPVQQQVSDLLREPRNLDLASEKPPVHIRERGEVLRHVGIPVLRLRVQGLEEFYQGRPDVLCPERREVAVECVRSSEHPRVFRIEAEHQSDAQLVEGLEGLRGFRVDVLRQQQVVQPSDQSSGRDGKVFLSLDVLLFVPDQKGQTGIVPLQILQKYDFGFVKRPVHVVDLERPEIAADNPAGAFACREVVVVAAGLLVRGEHRSARLRNLPRKVNLDSFLLDDDLCSGNVGVDEPGRGLHPDRFLKLDHSERILHPEDVREQL